MWGKQTISVKRLQETLKFIPASHLLPQGEKIYLPIICENYPVSRTSVSDGSATAHVNQITVINGLFGWEIEASELIKLLPQNNEPNEE